MKLMLRPNWPARSFRRVVRDKDGNPTHHAVVFHKGIVRSLTGKKLELVHSAIGTALVVAVLSKDGNGAKPDYEKTEYVSGIAQVPNSPDPAEETPPDVVTVDDAT